jgi:pimeloyl-ACP methyl ester carboxylesterase
VRSHHLLLLHGQPGSAADWRRVQARLPRRLRAVAVDRPGYGTSRLAAAGFAGNARAVLAEMDARGMDRAVLVGHSFGGGVALTAASLAPHRVEALVLLASVGPGCLNAVDRLLAAPGTGPACALIAFGVASWGYPRGEHHPLWRTFLVEQRALVQEIDQLAAALPGVRAPALLLADPRDMIVPVETSRRLEQSLPDARLRPIRGPGHMLPRRAASLVANAIAGFLASLDTPGGRTGHDGTGHAGRDWTDDGSASNGPAGDGVSARDPADHGSADHRPG